MADDQQHRDALTKQVSNQSSIPSTDVIQLTLTLKITPQVIETSVTVKKSSVQDFVHPNEQAQPTNEMTPGSNLLQLK